jgi:hypothetical protein
MAISAFPGFIFRGFRREGKTRLSSKRQVEIAGIAPVNLQWRTGVLYRLSAYVFSSTVIDLAVRRLDDSHDSYYTTSLLE